MTFSQRSEPFLNWKFRVSWNATRLGHKHTLHYIVYVVINASLRISSADIKLKESRLAYTCALFLSQFICAGFFFTRPRSFFPAPSAKTYWLEYPIHWLDAQRILGAMEFKCIHKSTPLFVCHSPFANSFDRSSGTKTA